MALLSKEEFYHMLGQAFRNAREKRGLSRAKAAEELNHVPRDPEQALRSAVAPSVMAAHIRRQKKLTRKQVAQRGNLSVEFVS